MKIQTLRPYQYLCYLTLYRYLTNGIREALMSGPTGCGKSLMLKFLFERLALLPTSRSFTVLTPQNQIKDSYLQEEDLCINPPNVHTPGRVSALSGVLVEKGQWFEINENRRELFKAHIRAVRPAARTLVTSHQAVTRWFKEDPDLLPKDLTGHFLAPDEGHHASEDNGIGVFVQEWVLRGGTVIPVTATAFRAEGDFFLDPDAPKWVWTLADLILSGFAPKDLILRSYPLSLKANRVDQLSGSSMPGYADLSFCEEIAKLWVKDGRRKSVIIVPIRGAEEMAAELERILPLFGARVFNSVLGGAKTTERLMEILRVERKAKKYSDSQYDVIIACARFNEGTDWPLCSAVYNIGLTRSFGLILQRLGRALRSKRDDEGNPLYEGFPEEHLDSALFTFLVPSASEQVFANFEQKHKDHAFLTACFMADFETGQGYLRGLRDRLGDDGRERTGEYRPSEETWEDVVQFINGDVQQCREATKQMVLAIIALQREGKPTPTNQDVKDYFVNRMGLEGEKLNRAVRALYYSLSKRKARAFEGFRTRFFKQSQGQDYKGDFRIIRETLQGIFDAVVDEFSEEEADLALVAKVLGYQSKFSGQDTKEIAKRLQQRYGAPRVNREQIIAAMRAYHAEYGKGPRKHSGDASKYFGFEKGAITWANVEGVLP